MGGVELALLIGGAGVAFVCWWINKDQPQVPTDDDPGPPTDYGADDDHQP